MQRSDFLSTFIGGTVLLLIGAVVITNFWNLLPYVFVMFLFGYLAFKSNAAKKRSNLFTSINAGANNHLISQAEQIDRTKHSRPE